MSTLSASGPEQRDLFAQLAPSMVLHPLWPALRPYFQIEECDRDGGRFRVEVQRLPDVLHAVALRVRVACCSCGHEMAPIRSRQPPGNKRNTHVGQSLYYACACPLEVRIGCSRGIAARNEYRRIKLAVLGSDPSILTALEGES